MTDRREYADGMEQDGRGAEDIRLDGEARAEQNDLPEASERPEKIDLSEPSDRPGRMPQMLVDEKRPEEDPVPEAGIEDLESAIEAELAQKLILEEELAQKNEEAEAGIRQSAGGTGNPNREIGAPEEKNGGSERETGVLEGEASGRGRSRARRSRRKGAAKAPGEGPVREPGQGTIREQAQDAAASGSRSLAAKKPDAEGKTEKKSSARKAGLMAACAAGILLIAGGGIYAGMAQKYKNAFFPNTQINGLDASGKSIEDVKAMIASGIDGYVLTLEEREGKSETLSGEAIGLHPEFDGSLETILESQNPYAWLSYQLNPASYTIETMVAYDDGALEEAVAALECMDPEQMKQPENASISGYVPGQGYSVIPETEGTAVEEEVLKTGIREAITNLHETFSLEEAGVYRAPEVRQDHPALLEQVNTMNRYAGVTVTYQFGDKTEVLNGDRIHQWIVTDESGAVNLDSAQVAKYVEELAVSYNTSNKAKTLKTSYGPTIQIKGGTYGWRINQQAEADELAAIIKSGESQSREPVYAQKAASHGENDYGDTYVEINLTAQHLFFYKDGNLVAESDFVSGNLSKGWGTPAGTYPLTYKQRDAILKGENYRTPVDYWMPFNGGIGMHDATWRSSFGGSIYKTGGSHGCINLPHSVAKKIYENISAGMPVLCYNLPGTEQRGSSAVTPPTEAPSVPPTEAPVIAPTEAPTAPAESQHQGPAGNQTEAPAPQPTEAPTPAPQPAEPPVPETTAPAGPGSDTGSGGGNGPGFSS